MIDERSSDGTGWAVFSDDRRMRYRLARALTSFGRDWMTARATKTPNATLTKPDTRAVFVMLNPSTADAFKLDPTVRRCVEFARRWGADVLEVVNLFAMRSPYPKDLLKWAAGDRGDHLENDNAILDAVAWPLTRVIAAWGNWGSLDGRANYVRELLRVRHVDLEALRFAQNGSPMHPLARGKSFIPYDKVPEVFA